MKILFKENDCINLQLCNGTVIEGRVTEVNDEGKYVLIRRIIRGRQLTEEEKDICVNTDYIVCWTKITEKDFNVMRLNINVSLLDTTSNLPNPIFYPQ